MQDETSQVQPYVFVSYASQDRSAVLELAHQLRTAGISAWMDVADIAGGVSYGPEIASGIKSSAALVLMCSAASLASRNVRQEIQLAWRYERAIVPLLLEPVVFPDDLIYWLEGAQWIEAFGPGQNNWLDQARRALVKLGFALEDPQARPLAPTISPEPVDLPPNNLPGQLPPLVGREQELRRLLALINNGRLVTVTGTGGAGKTRIALESGRRLAPSFPSGTWFVDAAADRTGENLVQTTASTLGIQEQPGESVRDALIRHLGDAEALLILDNLEQIRDAGSVVAALIDACPGLNVIATSRAPIRAPAEIVFRLGGLDLPATGTELRAVAAMRNPAVALFSERARQARADFALSDGNVRDVLAICSRLDGLPLAIELAAARIRLLPPAAILDRLDQSLSLLTRSSAALGDRQRTLRSTIAWSYDLLEPAAQRAFERLSVFAGGCTVEAAEFVIDDPEALDLIDGLIDQHLLTADSGRSSDPRLRMLETIREFAAGQLHDHGNEETTKLHHAGWYRDLAKSAFVDLEAGSNPGILDRLEAERANMRTAMASFAASSTENLGDLETADALWRFWWMRGHLQEGFAALTDAVSRNPGAPLELRGSALVSAAVISETRGDLAGAARILDGVIAMLDGTTHHALLARALSGRGNTAETAGDLDLASACFERALALYQELGHERGIAVTQHQLSSVLIVRGDYDRARLLAADALATWRKRGEMQSLSYSLQQLGIATYYLGDYSGAATHYQETVDIAESLGDQLGQGNGLLNLGSALEMSGDLEASLQKFAQALAIYESLQDAGGIGYAHYQIGHLQRTLGDLSEATQLLMNAHRHLSAVGDRPTMALVLETLAGVEIDLGRPERAAVLFGAAEALRDKIGAPVPSTRVQEVTRDRSAALAALGPDRFADEVERGRNTDPVQINIDPAN